MTGLGRRAAGDTVLNVVLVGDREILELNRQYLGHDYVTDVIAFDFGDDDLIDCPGTGNVHGEIYICLPEAVRRAAEFGNSVGREVVLYAVHGMLHLAGFDDQTEEGLRRMSQEQERILNDLSRRVDIKSLFV